MRVNLKCPFCEKDAAKSLGAKWDAAQKTWYIVNVEDLTPFMRWIKNAPRTLRTEPQPIVVKQKRAFVTIGQSAPKAFPDDPYPPWEEAPDMESIRFLRSL